MVLRIGLIIIIFWGIFFNASLLLSQYAHSDIKFERVTAAAGGPEAIQCIIQDRKGFLWIGTSDGISRYDGCNFKEYKHKSGDPRSLSNNTVYFIHEDQKGNLWIGTDKGLNKFNRKTGDFKIYLPDPGNPGKSLSHHMVTAIYEERDGVLWVGTYGGGLNKLELTEVVEKEKNKKKKIEKAAFVHYKYDANNPTSLSDNDVRAIYEDEDGVMWIGTDGGGLNRFGKETGEFTHFKHDPQDPSSLSDNHVMTIYGDKSGALWIGTNDGLNKLLPEEAEDPGKRKTAFIRYKHEPDNPHSLSHNRVYTIYEDSSETLWIGTRGGGLNRMEGETFFHYQQQRNNPYSLSGDMVNSIYEDRTGVLWVGTHDAGLNKFNRRTSILRHYYSNPGIPGSLKHDVILSIYEDRSGTVWLGTFGEGLARFDREKGIFTHYKHKCEDEEESVKCNMILAIHEDNWGTLWVGSDGGGLGTFDRKTEQFTFYRHDEKNPNSLSNDTILAILEDRFGELWIGTEKGLNKWDRQNQPFTHYYHDPDDDESPYHLSNNYVLTLFEEPGESEYYLWIGLYNGGINRFDPKGGQFIHCKHDSANPGSLSSDNVRCIYKDTSERVWIGTDNGLNRLLDWETKQFKSYKEKDGLAGNTVYGILEDDAGSLWISTNKGLSRFDAAANEFKNYDARDGVQHKKFNHNAYMKSRRTGEMFFGGINGLNVFEPDKLRKHVNANIPPIVITDLQILHESVLIRPGHDTSRKKLYAEAEKIVLPYEDYLMTIEFSALDFTVPGKNQYKYRLDGVDSQWKEVNAANRFARYMNLSPGTYTFQVKGSNNDGQWNEKGISLQITILPPFWQEWWFLILAGILLIFIIFAGYQWRTKRLRKSRDEMEKAKNLAEFRNAENEKLIAAIASIFIAVDADGKVSQWNQPSEKFFGMTANEVLKKSFVERLKDYIPVDKLEEIMQMGLHRDKAANNVEIPVQPLNRGKDNDPKLLLANINPIMDRSGKTFGFILLAEDITYQKEEEMQRFLSQKLEALGQMAAGIAHEIRSPLQYIGDNSRFLMEAFGGLIAYSLEVKNSVKKSEKSGETIDLEKLNQFLDEGDFDFFVEEIPKAAEQIETGVTRVSHIVQSMNEFAHTGDGVEDKSNLNDLLKSTLVVAHNRIKKVADLETDFAPNLPLVPCGMGELNQVFLNLLINAADAIAETGKRGVIKITTRRKENELVVEISDTGTGIPENIEDKIFTPFFTTKKVGQGTGQGLHFSYRIVVERLKGKLYFKNSVNQGTTFYVHLPIKED